MSFTAEQVEQLQAPLDGSQVKTREQAGRKLSYIEGWAAIDTANRIFGHGNWSYHVIGLTHIGTREVTNQQGRKGHEVAYYAVVRLTVGTDTLYEDTGYGSGTDYNSPFSAHESATKEAVTDALKRCFKNLGYPFGLALYDKTQEHVDHGEPAHAPASRSPRPDAPSRPSEPAKAEAPAGEFVPNHADPGATVITWGKHKGKTLRQVGSDYAEYMLKKIAEDGKPSKIEAILKAFADQRADEKAEEAAKLAEGLDKEPDGSESDDDYDNRITL